MEARVAVLEEIAKSTSALLKEMRDDAKKSREEVTKKLDDARDRHDRDFRITFGAMIGVALGLAGLMAKGFKWL